MSGRALNILLVEDNRRDETLVLRAFRKNNILIGRHFPPMDTYIRVSLGRPEEMLAFWRTWDLLPFAKDFMHH